MAIPEQTITGVSGLGATLLEFCGRQRRNSIPYQLKFSATADATPVRWLPPVVWGALFFPQRFWPTFRPEAPAEICAADNRRVEKLKNASKGQNSEMSRHEVGNVNLADNGVVLWRFGPARCCATFAAAWTGQTERQRGATASCLTM
jgi:hypothetical protein